ncbi:hypothetical protein Chor_005533 [Crotalus horridus]
MACPLGGSSPVLLLCVLVFASANLIQFGHIIEHLTGRHPLIYNGYGCYCGLGGSRQPVDATDWQAPNGPGCRDGHSDVVTLAAQLWLCSLLPGGETECRRETCECDKAAALCFRHSKFQGQYIGYRNRLCEGPTPPCQGVCPCWAPTKGG